MAMMIENQEERREPWRGTGFRRISQEATAVTHHVGDTVVVTFAGVLHEPSLRGLRRVLSHVVETRPRWLVLDATRLTGMDPDCLTAFLVALRRRTTSLDGGGTALRLPGPDRRRPPRWTSDAPRSGRTSSGGRGSTGPRIERQAASKRRTVRCAS